MEHCRQRMLPAVLSICRGNGNALEQGEAQAGRVVGVPPRVYSGMAAHLAAVMHIGCMYCRCGHDTASL